MSDPIRSISQNNFILADQKEVAHDNTLSGNGTPESPLGLNETVLWETNSPAALTTFTLSEEASNFEFVDFHFRLAQPSTVDYVLRFLGGTASVSLVGFFNGDRTIWVSSTMFTTSDHKIFNRYQYKWNIGIGQGGDSNDVIRILKVVGINRIANN